MRDLATPRKDQAASTCRPAFRHARSTLSIARACFVLSLLGALGCSRRADDCTYNLTCAGSTLTDAGTSGGSASSGGGPSDSGAGGSANTGGASTTTDVCGGCNEAGGLHCDPILAQCVECGDAGECDDTSQPYCNAQYKCVQCLANDNCTNPATSSCASGTCAACSTSDDCKHLTATPLCNTGTGTARCVECLSNDNCTDISRSLCSSGACTACTTSNDCAHLTQTPVCKVNSGAATGSCVKCTEADVSACNGNSCDPATNTCTTTALGMTDFCHSCVSDAECVGGNQQTPTARCVPLKYASGSRGNYCLPIGTTVSSCTPFAPFGVLTDAIASVSGAAAQRYCGIDQTTTTCEAILDLKGLKSCSIAAECGCVNGANCAGGLCPTTGTMAGTCTVSCALATQCPTTLTCTSSEPVCH